MANVVNTEEKIIRVRSAKDSTDNWEKANPILLDGEIGIEMKPDGSIAIKVGDGKTAWKLLQYVTKTIKDADAEFQNLQNQLDNIVLASSDSGDVTAEVAQARVSIDGTNFGTLKDRLDADQNALAIEIGRVETDILSVREDLTNYLGGCNVTGFGNDVYVHAICDINISAGDKIYVVINSVNPTVQTASVYGYIGTEYTKIGTINCDGNVYEIEANDDYDAVHAVFNYGVTTECEYNVTVAKSDKTISGIAFQSYVASSRIDSKADKSEIGDINESISSISKKLTNINPTNIQGAKIGKNLINPYDIIYGEYVNENTGNITTEYSNYCHTDFISVKPNTKYSLNATTYSATVFYDSDKNYIGGVKSYTFTTPSDACYVICNIHDYQLDGYFLYEGGNAPYVPFEISLEWLKINTPIITPNEIDGAYFINMFDKNATIDGKYVEHTNGAFSSNDTYFRTDYISVKPNTIYKKSSTNRYAFYDENLEYISGENGVTTFTSPGNAKYIVICDLITKKEQMVLAESEHYPETYESYGCVVPWLKSSAPKSKYDGKKMVCFGDSITNQGYTDVIKEDTGIEAINVGCSSARYAYSEDSNEYVNAFALHNIIDSLVSGDWTIPDKIIGVSGYESQAQRIATLKTIDFSTIDFVSFAYGTNDFSSATPFDNENDLFDVNYFKGAMRYSLKKFTETYPHIKIIVATPIYRFWVNSGTVLYDSDEHQVGGLYLKQYVDAIKAVCDEFHIPCVDNYSNAGINKYNRLTYFNISDGLHPNKTGRAIIGHRIGNGILSEY